MPALVVVLLSLLCAACGSYETTLARFDTVSPILDLQADPTAKWVYRDIPGSDEENPARVARECMVSLTEEAVGDLHRSGEVLLRLLWVADPAPSPLSRTYALNRIYALRGMARLMTHLGLPLVMLDAPPPEPVPEPDSRDQLAALTDLNGAWLTGTARSEADRQRQLALLDGFTRPLATSSQRRDLVAGLSRSWRLAPDADLRRAAERALRLAMHFAVYTVYLRTIQGDAPAEFPLRQAAIAEIHRQTGPDSVAWLVAMASRSSDPSSYVLLDLVRMCAQLDPERAQRGHRGGPAPAEFLYELVRAPAVPRGLRLMALEGLALSLGKPVAFELPWAHQWYDDWNQQRILRGPDR